ncbi:hypothetical protein SAMN05660209_05035 [Geodermatophilus africanus]|uniref:Uncharacterized protein n=1 Tax=Geodermatophilus africanus TaxID=1137993 RepID=A0A1H3R6K9_9ACTN|nr:hypothetical protein [Geodermatophilus africanus]SDZ20911.1 hypothetical protein SAMN05660209_05035 [Geodermatophilus africanus]
MTGDAATFATERFLSSVRVPGRLGSGVHPWTLGRLLEARAIAAIGVGCGYFAEPTVQSWLEATEESVAEMVERFHDSLSRLPLWLSSEELASAPRSTEEAARGDQLRFQETLLLRRSLGGAYHLQRFVQLLMFGGDRQWQSLLGDLETSVWENSSRTNAIPSIQVADGFFACIEAVSTFLDFVGEPGSPGDESDAAIPLRAMSARLMDGVRTAELYLEHSFGQNGSPEELEPVAFVLEEGARTALQEFLGIARLHSWLRTAAQGSHNDIFDVYVQPEVARRVEVMARLSGGAQLAWTWLLWRIAPADLRSRERLRQVSDRCLFQVEQLSDGRPLQSRRWW